MNPIIELTGVVLADLRAALDPNRKGALWSLKIAIDDGGAKFKINNGTWSPPLGDEVLP